MDDYAGILANYRALTVRVDELCRSIAAQYSEQLSCRAGCDECCRHISIFPVEAAALAVAMGKLPAENCSHVRDRGRGAANEGSCPLLEDGLCLLYRDRPIICRTHGYPILAGTGKMANVDFCPKNFSGVASFPSSFVINLEVVNTTLAAINAVFLNSCHDLFAGKERLTIAEAILLDGFY